MENIINLEQIADGALKESFNIAMKEVLENIKDPNTDYKVKRKLTLELTFVTSEDREISDVTIVPKTKLASRKGIVTRFIIDKDGNGNVVASEYKKQIPGQTYMKVDNEVNKNIEENSSTEGLEYLVNLGEENEPIVELNQGTYSKIQLNRVEKPRADYLQISTLTGLIDYVKANIDKLDSELLIHIKAHDDVVLSSPLNGDRRRETYIRAEAILPNNIYYNQFLNTEQFNIMLQSSFISNKDRELLLKVTGCVKDEAIKQIGDDGVSQAATIKTGVASVNDVKIPNPVLLAPFRTLPEVKQPESKFIFRMQSGPRAALYEADGGAWRNEAIKNIKEYLEEQLKEVKNIKIIA